MPRIVFEKLRDALKGNEIFVKWCDDFENAGISPYVRIIAALCILVYGKAFGEVDGLVEISTTSA